MMVKKKKPTGISEWGILSIYWKDSTFEPEFITLTEEPILEQGVLAYPYEEFNTPTGTFRYIPIANIREFYVTKNQGARDD